MANIVEIVIRGLDQTKAPFTQSIKNFKDVEKAASGMTTLIVGAGVAAAGALALVTNRAINNADEMGKMAQKAQMPVQAFSQLAHSADMAGVSAEQLKGGFVQLNKNISEAAANAESEAAKGFRAMGVAVTDANGKLRSNEAIFYDLSNRFSSYADDANKGALASQIFGKAIGPDLLPLLNQGAAGIKEVASEIQGVDGEMAANAETFNDNLSRLKASFFEVGTTLAKALLPYLAEFSSWIVRLQKDNGVFSAIALTVVDVLKGMAVAAHGVYTVFQVLGKGIGTQAYIISEFIGGALTVGIGIFKAWAETILSVVRGIVNLGKAAGDVGMILKQFFTGDFEGAWSTSKEMVERMKDAVLNAGTAIAESWDKNGAKVGESLVQSYENIKGAGKNLIADVKKDFAELGQFSMDLFSPKKMQVSTETKGGTGAAPVITDAATDHSIKNLQKIADMQSKLHADGLRGAQLEQAQINENYQKQIQQIGLLSATEEQSIEMSLQAFENKELRLTELATEGARVRAELEAQLTAETLGHWEQQRFGYEAMFQERLLKIGQLNLSEEDSLRLVNLATVRHTQERVAMHRQMASAVAGVLGNMAETAQAFGKKGFAAYKAIASAQAMINTYSSAVAAYNAMAGIPVVGPALAVAAAAAAVAAGLANVAAINSSQPVGQAHAGMNSVPTEGSWILQQGERVVQPEANKDLTDFLNSGGRSSSDRGPIYLMIDGAQLGKIIGDLSQSGQLEISANSIV